MTKVADAEQLKQWQEQAEQTVDRFVSRFDESYRLLAYHAALPLVLTPELVNYLRNEFLREEQVPWVAEVDLLLSDLCSQVGYELYAMDSHVRAYLLEEMEQDKRFGKRRMQEVAQVLISYVSYLSRLNPGRRRQEIEAQRWAAMVYLGEEKCKTAALEIAKRLLETSSGAGSQNLNQSGIRAELARLTRITEELSQPLRQEPSLLKYARLVQQILRNPEQVNPEELQESYQAAGVPLEIPRQFLPEHLAQTVPTSSVRVTQLEGFPPIQTCQFEVATYFESEFEICSFQVVTIEKGLNTGKNIKWLFQGNPKNYRMLDAIRDLEEMPWPLSRHTKDIAVGDEVLIWVSGKESGIYALGKIIEPVKIFEEISDIDYWIDTNLLSNLRTKPGPRIRLTTKLLYKPLLKKKLKHDDILKDLLVIRNPRFSCSKITPEQSTRIYELVEGSHLNFKTTTSEAEYYAEDLGDEVQLEMIVLPEGTFMMGTEDEEIERLTEKFGDYFKYESPQHEVTIQPFCMSKYPITQRQWKAIALRTDLKVKEDLEPEPSYYKDNPQSFSFPATRGKLDLPYYGENPTYLDRPVEYVNWYEAKEFCDRLSRLTGKEYRLPTEAEWEYACRAGTGTPFYFGETITSDLANYNGEYIYADEPKGVYRDETTPVGMFPPNAFGLYDMHGNVWEWCEDDWHDNYNEAPNNGTAWKTEDAKHIVLRGGSFGNYPRYCRSASRYGNDARVIDAIGFRVACVLPRTS